MAYEEVIVSASKQYGVDPNLIKAFIRTESSWNPKAIGDDGKSYGLMQVQLTTARETAGNSALTTAQLMDPTVNILVGTKYVAKQLARYPGNKNAAFSAYNAGSALYSTSSPGKFVNQAYVDKINKNYVFYRGIGGVTTMLPFLALGAMGLVIVMGGRSGGR